jgi:large subunit ribosomal protein L23
MKRAFDQIIKRPLALTEKATELLSANNQVVFEVDRTANKIEIRDAVEALFGVKVEGVNTLIQRGKPKRMGRSFAQRKNWKKAIVTLRAGDEIDFFGEAKQE